MKSAERELRCPRACLSNRDDLPVSRPNRFDRSVLARCLRIDKLDVVLHPDSGGVARLERDLPGVFRLLQAVAAEAVPERALFPKTNSTRSFINLSAMIISTAAELFTASLHRILRPALLGHE